MAGQTTINATVRGAPRQFNGMVSVPITTDGMNADAKAFARSPLATAAVLAMGDDENVRLHGKWETNRRDSRKVFVVETVLATDANVCETCLTYHGRTVEMVTAIKCDECQQSAKYASHKPHCPTCGCTNDDDFVLAHF